MAFTDCLPSQDSLSDSQCASKVPVLGEGTQGPSGISQLPPPLAALVYRERAG